MGLSSVLKALAEDMAAGVKLAASPGSQANVFIGPRFATDRELLDLNKARSLLSRRSAKSDPMNARTQVWQDTGWFGWGDDGLDLKYPQLRVSDYGTDYRPGVTSAGPLETTLGEAYDHPELSARMGKTFDDLPVSLRSMGRPGAAFDIGYAPGADPKALGIRVSTDTFSPDAPKNLNPRGVMLHEINHYDQFLNQHPNGGSPRHDLFWETNGGADAAAIAEVLKGYGVTGKTPWMQLSQAVDELAAGVGLKSSDLPPKSKVMRILQDFGAARKGTKSWYESHPGRIAWNETMAAPSTYPHDVYRHGGAGRGELPAWQTYFEAIDNRPPEQAKNVPPFRTMFPQDLHGVNEDEALRRARRAQAIADSLRTAGGLGVLSAAVGGASQYARDQKPEGDML